MSWNAQPPAAARQATGGQTIDSPPQLADELTVPQASRLPALLDIGRGRYVNLADVVGISWCWRRVHPDGYFVADEPSAVHRLRNGELVWGEQLERRLYLELDTATGTLSYWVDYAIALRIAETLAAASVPLIGGTA